ncbi:MAG: N-acyl homoserine lactonase family protein [Clostridia bacterium]|nr:N-acyl homoserine lactonase family protein [Clostridia bacterium]
MIKIHIFHTGSIRIDRAVAYKEENPLTVTGFLRGKKKKIELPVSCYLIEHPKGLVLIDTGLNPLFAEEQPRRALNLREMTVKPILSAGESIDCRLKEMGIEASDIDFIFLSHLDFDHTGGLAAMSTAKNIMTSEEEIEDAEKYHLRYDKNNWSGVELKPFRYNWTEIGPANKSYDVWGDGSVLLIKTPGHTHGMFSAVVSQGDKFAVLTSDAVYTVRSRRERIIPGITVDKEEAAKSLKWVCDFDKDRDCILIAANHDPEIKPGCVVLK